MKVGFVGLGNMGGAICRRLIQQGNHDVSVFDLNVNAMDVCASLGAKRAANIAELASGNELILMSLATPAQVESVALGNAGVSEHARAGTVVLDFSTNSPAVVRRIHAALAARKISLLDAPVSGGAPRALEGKLLIMISGDESVFEAQRELLAAFASQVVYLGSIGSASVAKLVNNMLVLCNMAAAAEGLMIGAREGIDLNRLNEVISNGTGNSVGYRAVAAQVLRGGEYKANFALELAYKDMRMACELAEEVGTPAMMGAQVLNLLQMARGMGFGAMDATAVMKVYEKLLGQQVQSDAIEKRSKRV